MSASDTVNRKVSIMMQEIARRTTPEDHKEIRIEIERLYCVEEAATRTAETIAAGATKAPFHYGLFFNAVENLLKREPDNAVRAGWDGFYHFVYLPKDDDDARFLEEKAVAINQWLESFAVLPRTFCQYGPPRLPWRDDKPMLELVVYCMPPQPVKR